MGGLIFGYDTGQISGFEAMVNFQNNFADEGPLNHKTFSNARSGTIVGLLSIGCLCGAILAAPVADRFGRKIGIITWDIVFIIGVVIQISAFTSWVQIAIGRLIAGFGVGALSVMTPMYQAETAPRQIRGSLISCYQLFITFGIFLAYCINYGTEKIHSRASWKIVMGIGFIFPAFMAVGMLFLPESPRWEFRHGKIDSARKTIALAYGVPEDHWEVSRELSEIREKYEAENAGGAHPWYEVFTGPRMAYRTILGMPLQAMQQLTGANYFFYYGTSIFKATGLNNGFAVSLILGGINFGSTFIGIYNVEHFGRRKALIAGGFWMCICFLIFASVGHFDLNVADPRATPTQGKVLIAFAAIFIFGYAITWGPMVWCLVGEIYPTRYRATAMGIATSVNWIFNFLISFFTPFITSDINYAYGYVFAGCTFAGALIVYFFVIETQGRKLEEIDTMYILHVKPWESAKWQVPEEGLVTTDKLNLTTGGRDIRKTDEGSGEKVEDPNGQRPLVEQQV